MPFKKSRLFDFFIVDACSFMTKIVGDSWLVWANSFWTFARHKTAEIMKEPPEPKPYRTGLCIYCCLKINNILQDWLLRFGTVGRIIAKGPLNPRVKFWIGLLPLDYKGRFTRLINCLISLYTYVYFPPSSNPFLFSIHIYANASNTTLYFNSSTLFLLFGFLWITQ